MLDINKIRDSKEEVEKALLKRIKPADFNLDKILNLDDARKKLTKERDDKRMMLNIISKEKPTETNIQTNRELSHEIKKNIEPKLDEIEKELNELISALPNLPTDDVVAGGKENNEIIKVFGSPYLYSGETDKKPEFKFEPKDHIKLSASLKLIDYERTAKMSGSGFWTYTGEGAILEWALLNYFIEFHRKNKYTFLIPPYLLNEASAYASGHLPKFKEDLFWIEKDGLCLNATSEMMLLNYHRDEIFNEKELPKKYFGYSACFRREAGSYRAEEKGMIRGHQFNKIEMFVYAKPQDSWKMFEEMVKNAQKLIEGLNLDFQTVKLAAGDASDAMAKTYDIEVWIPSMGIYKEVSSISNGLDYQARRGNIRYKNENGKNEFVHTLNASGLATSRLLPAILEQNQQKDGSIIVPKVLRKFVGKKVLK